MKRDVDANINKNATAQVRPFDKDTETESQQKKPNMQSRQAGGGDEYLATSLRNKINCQNNFDSYYINRAKEWDVQLGTHWDDNWYANSRKATRIQLHAQSGWEKLLPQRKSPGVISNLVEQ